MRKFTISILTLALTAFSSSLSMSHAAEVKVLGLDTELMQTMNALIKPRLEFINQRPATEWRADDAAFFLQTLLKKQGYADSNIKWEIPNNNLILLKAELGVRYVIGKISSASDDPLSDELMTGYFSELITTNTFLKRKQSPYLSGYPEKGATNIANKLKSEGYWDAKVTVASINKKTNGEVDIQLNINRGKTHTILPPKFTGITQQQQQIIHEKCASFTGLTATSANIGALNKAVHDYYREQGYQFAKITVQSENSEGISITYNINTGNIYTVRKVTIAGHKKVKRSRFNRYTSPLVGKTYYEKDTNEVTKKLLLTGGFESVRFVPEKISPTEVDINIEVKEAKPRFIRAYSGVASFDGFLLGASYTNQNFFKKLQTLSATAEINSRGFLGELSLTEPYFAGIPISQTTRIYALQRRFDGYRKNQTGLETAFKWEPNASLTSRLYSSLDYIRIESIGLTPQELGSDEYANFKVGFEQTLDLRDSPILPTRGFHTQGLIEYGTLTNDASNTYIRTDFNASYRHQLQTQNKSRLLFRFSTGAIFPSGSNDLPVDIRLFSGGADSIRSFAERELGPLSASNDPLGGQAYWNASAEYIHPFNDLFSGLLFYDAGSLFSEAGDYSFSDPSHSIGLGLRIDLPVGPVRLEYGYNLNQQPDEASGAFHFSIGAQF